MCFFFVNCLVSKDLLSATSRVILDGFICFASDSGVAKRILLAAHIIQVYSPTKISIRHHYPGITLLLTVAYRVITRQGRFTLLSHKMAVMIQKKQVFLEYSIIEAAHPLFWSCAGQLCELKESRLWSWGKGLATMNFRLTTAR